VNHSLIRRAVAVAGAVAALSAGSPAAAASTAPHTRTEAVAATEASDHPVLSLGDSGASVAAWERQVNLLTRTTYLAVDGVYSAATELATMNFQRLFQLGVDGVVGEHTRDVMRFMLAATRDYTSLFDYDGRKIVGYGGDDSYCFEVQTATQFSVECPALSHGPVDGEAIAVQGTSELQLVGTIDPSVASVEIDTINGPVPADVLADVRGLARHVWSTALPSSQITAVRALAADGSEIRHLVVSDAEAYLVLERGDRGPAVQRWEEQLESVTHAGLAADGIFGERVTEATRNFQAFFGLHVDGIVGPETRDAMAAIQAALP
jgi:peptidoglycan hydrolase-like protein with peptidoglycan-binding domain